ncbi:hypothetical protein BABINDRAFT_171284 [Babjeviella inositovora NRRL Y-12698]|uniref:Large ribosomal subunit protein mL46 n=1 Tax=Babjeviella inositovora NRRL Y-12698 TaxID=984486 RepID=A0A1E3QRM0_9ASCO|nr:uncharacterized protein BABINDRAFT_171284 [Babjeviella inositovora NRRL Y-12698]ODQ80356.1 hypothetical protein BABINDRAFT_171284 [Babjeviella inositovora NRRL Y-12698]
MIVSRTPIITQEIPEFDQQYQTYQSELEKRLMWTFPKFFYFKKGTLAERAFRKLQRYPSAPQPGVYFPHGKPDIKFDRDRRLKQDIVLRVPDEVKVNEAGETITTSEVDDETIAAFVPNSRTTEADRTNDVLSLERKLSRTLYLLVKDQSNTKGWAFPAFPLASKQPLHINAEVGIKTLGGPNMKLWTVSNTPCQLLKFSQGQLAVESAENVTREFMIKAHILAGDFEAPGVTHAWLTKEEIKEKCDGAYFEQVAHLLAEN